ncbi:hypothetical protein F5H01DRAFT_342991 [Linnemannia elongata]|nr:hypothetical protein F5H01DRAFT_342991 [Linnemannia elongata]
MVCLKGGTFVNLAVHIHSSSFPFSFLSPTSHIFCLSSLYNIQYNILFSSLRIYVLLFCMLQYLLYLLVYFCNCMPGCLIVTVCLSHVYPSAHESVALLWTPLP